MVLRVRRCLTKIGGPLRPPVSSTEPRASTAIRLIKPQTEGVRSDKEVASRASNVVAGIIRGRMQVGVRPCQKPSEMRTPPPVRVRIGRMETAG
jgi:hypothetical protein